MHKHPALGLQAGCLVVQGVDSKAMQSQKGGPVRESVCAGTRGQRGLLCRAKGLDVKCEGFCGLSDCDLSFYSATATVLLMRG